MTDTAQLREALKRFQMAIGAYTGSQHTDPRWQESIDDYRRLIAAASKYLTLREAGALIIVPDEATVERVVDEILKFGTTPARERGLHHIRQAARNILDAINVVDDSEASE